MARRPKRTLVEELEAHESLALSQHTAVAVLAALQPDVAEFGMARVMLDAGVEKLRERLAAARHTSDAIAADTAEPGR